MAYEAAAARVGGLQRVKTLGWSGAENFSRQILALLFFFVIVRFQQPSDLGIFALAVALNCIFGVFIDDPIGEALVQKAVVTDADWDTGFCANLLIAATCVVLSLLASGVMAAVMHEPQLALAVPALSLAALAGATGNIHRAYLSRILHFRAIALTALFAQVVGGLTGVALAVAGLGYWAQIGNVGITAAAGSLVFWRISPWRPRLAVHRATIASRLPYALYSLMIRSVYLLRDQAPTLIVGWLAGVSEVGFLTLALRVARSLGQLFEDLASRPVLSLLSREQHDMAGFGAALLDILTIIGLVAIPAFAGLAVIGQALLPLAFGAVWAPAGAMLPWMCAVLAGWLLLHVVIVSLRARNLGRLALAITAPAVFLDVLVLAVLMPFGLRWALIGWAARATLSVPVALVVLRRHLGVRGRALAGCWAAPLAGTLAMLALLAGLDEEPLLGRGAIGLVLTIAAAATLYGTVVLALAPTLRRRAAAVLRQRRGRD